METIVNNQIPLDLDEGKRKREAELLQKTKVKKANEIELNTRKKPGRKRLEVTESNTKKEKNRVAQRAWRERKEKYVLELEAKIAELENAKNKSENEKQQLKLIIEKLRSENTYLKNATSFIFTPTKETEMFMEQNKLKILQQKNLKQNNQMLNNSVPIGVQTPVTPELINEPLPALSTDGINESLLSQSNPEILNELYKLINMQNSELMAYQNGLLSPKDSTNQDSSINSILLNPSSLINSNCDSTTLCSDLTTSNDVLNTNNDSLYNVIPSMQKESVVIPNNFEINSSISTTDTTDPNLLLLMNDQNNPNKDLAQALLNQQQLSTINSNMIGSTNSEVLQNTLASSLNNQAIDQNSLLAMTMLNNVPNQSFENIQPSTANIDNGLYSINGLEMNNDINANISKPIVNGRMNYRTEAVKEKAQPISDELFNNMIQLLHQQQQANLDGNDEDDLLIQQINQNSRKGYTNTITGIPSPSNISNYCREIPSTPDNIGAPYTPKDLDTDSNKSGDGGYITSQGIEIRSRGIEIPDNDNDNDNSKNNVKSEEKRTNSTRSTLQFPAEQKPTKLNIPYSVFPRVTQETVDNFINDAKLSDEELENLCCELKNKATCKEKLKYISKNIEVEGWDIETWKKGKIRTEEEEKKGELKNEQIKKK
jgi:hypothetical protein